MPTTYAMAKSRSPPEIVADHLEQEAQHAVSEREDEKNLAPEAQCFANPKDQREQERTDERLVDLSGVHGERGRRFVVDEMVLHMLHPRGRPRAMRQRAFRPMRECAHLFQPLRSPWRKRFSKITAEEVTAESREQEARGEARCGDVAPWPERDLVAPQVDHRPNEAAQESTVRDEATAPEREDLPERFELARSGHVVKNTRHDHRAKSGEHVTVGERLLGKSILLREAERQVPAHDERQPEHDAVAVDGNRRKVAEELPAWQGNP